jgi:peptidyl-prolyl cis-trans isomerase D
MLQGIRDHFTGPLAFLIIGAIGAMLVISFGNMDTSGGVGEFAAEVNGEEIPLANYRRVLQAQVLRQQEAFQGELPPEMQQQLERNVLETMVRNRVVAQYVRDSGYRVSEQRLRDYIRSLPVFQVGGEYSYESYIAVLSSQGMSPDSFERDQRTGLELDQLENGIAASAFYTPAEYRRYIELVAERREATYVSFDPISMAAEVKVPEEAMRVFYEANPQRYQTEESVDLEYVEIRLDDIKQTIFVEEAAVVEFFDANAERFLTGEQRQARHILIAVNDNWNYESAEQLASELAGRLAAGEDFAALAEEFSDDPVSAKQGGDLGWAGRGDYVAAFEDALFALEKDATSDPVRTEFGYHLIRLENIQAGQQRSFADARDELVEELKLREAVDQYYFLAEKIDDLALEAATSLDFVANEAGLELKTAENFSRAGGEPFGYSQPLVDAAFSMAVLDDGENSPLIELENDHAIVLRVTEHRPSELQTFDEVRKSVAELVRLELAAENATTRGKEVLGRVEGGESLDALAAEYGFKLENPGELNRGSDTINAHLLAAIFRASKPGDGAPEFWGVALGTGGYAVFRLDKVKPGVPDEIAQGARDERKRDLAQQQGGALATALITDLRSAADVFVAPGLFEQTESL